MKSPSGWSRHFQTLMEKYGPGKARKAGATFSDDVHLASELFTTDQIAEFGQSLAGTHEIRAGYLADRLLPALATNEKALRKAFAVLEQDAQDQRPITHAGTWLLDNIYLIEEEIRTAKRHLPPSYSHELQRLRGGPSAGLPRVYDLVQQWVVHSDGRFSRINLLRFVASYQTAKQLKLGELWAIPIMIRLALIESLCRASASILASRQHRELAGNWAKLMLEAADKDPKGLILVVADLARSNLQLTSAFVSELLRRLQGRNAALSLPLTWIGQHLSESNQTIEQLVQAEARHQAALQVSVSNCIGSLRALGTTEWRELVESLSSVDQALRQDPAEVYAKMDFTTRDQYRKVIERVAATSPLAEHEVAQVAIELARQGALKPSVDRPNAAHVGHYLLGAGRAELERRAKARFSPWRRLKLGSARHPLPLYAGSIGTLTLLLGAAVLQWTSGPVWGGFAEIEALGWRLTAAAVLLPVASRLAVSLVNWAVGLLVTPVPLPRMNYSDGIAPVSRTLVVVPTMLGGAHGIEDLVEKLEVRFLGNRDPHLQFALLTDFHDAATETCAEDQALLDLVRERIEALNAKYPPAGGDAPHGCFLLLHRPRRWNAQDRVWMGHERKRGKLADLNALLRGGSDAEPGQRFSLIVGDTSVLSQVRYVITLDTDTQLPRDAARQFAATMAHPLNRPQFGGDPQAPRVISGYGILQPRVGVSLTSSNGSLYARLCGGEPGIDPYTRVVSDVYQDLFGEGSFIGKGIYDVDAFERVLGGRLPENRILSHDLLEGCYARSGLISDIELVEDAPLRYDQDSNRRHRWIRGDWQLIGWLMPTLSMRAITPFDADASAAKLPQSKIVQSRNPLSPLSRLKILDNLIRSLAPAAMTALLLLGWTLLQPASGWTLACLAVLLIPPTLALITNMLREPEELRPRQHLPVTAPSALHQFALALVNLACLPFEAAYSLDAIVRTLWRLGFSQHRLLQWQAYADAARRTRGSAGADLWQTFKKMWLGPALAVGTGLGLARYNSVALAPAAPVLILWLVSPFIVWWISRPLRRKVSTLSRQQTEFLRLLGRRTWAFFETFVGAPDHFLPPDNMQQRPVERIAHRTSPTNIGLSLLANLAASDFGYITQGQLIERTQATLDTLDRLEKYQGHLLNWYDTQTLQPLAPRYVSTVDSGNLCGHLLTLSAGLHLLANEPPALLRLLDGMRDTLALVRQCLTKPEADSPLIRFEVLLASTQAQAPQTALALRSAFDALRLAARALVERYGLAAPGKDSWQQDEQQHWLQALLAQCEAAAREIRLLSIDAAQAHASEWNGPAQTLRRTQLQILADRARALTRTQYGFLYDPGHKLLTIGYNVDEHRRDSGHYDLLASEIRLASFVAIAKGQVPQESWFAMGRLLTTVDRQSALMSWTGSMFEYLMPMLVMPSYENTLLDQTMQAAVDRQIGYGRQRGVPWGMSESGYNAIDMDLNHQYRAFGVPGLGLKRGLAQELVVAPYATMIALMVSPLAAYQNLQRLKQEGLAGTFGYYEAIDYTPAHLPRGQRSAVVYSYMAHHQGMSLLALTYLLLGQPMQRRFEADVELQSALLLLQERIPKVLAFRPHTADHGTTQGSLMASAKPVRLITTADTPAPELQLLSNGRYHVLLTNTGAGYSRWNEIAVTRWREDTTCDEWGSFCYLRDAEAGTFWSNTHQPTKWKSDAYEAIFSKGRVEYRRRDQGIASYTEIVVSPEDDIELRRLRLTNQSPRRRVIEVTSYTEVVLTTAAADAQHPAFGNLFVQTELLADPPALLCTRRARTTDEQPPHMLHVMVVHGAQVGPPSHETDRSRFIGRGRSLHAPAALREPGPLSNSVGSVLDPVLATRRSITLEPGQTATIDLVYGVAQTREACIVLIRKYLDQRMADRVFHLSWTHSEVVLRQINASEAEAQLFAQLAGAVVYSQPGLRADSDLLMRNRRSQSGLWGYAISGDLPVVLVQVRDPANIKLARQMVQAHSWWRLKGLQVDLVIWNEDRDVYRHRLQEQILGLIGTSVEAQVMDRSGGIFVRQAEHIPHEDRILLLAVARVVISDQHGTLEEQLRSKRRSHRRQPALLPTRAPEPPVQGELLQAAPNLLFFNGFGGFTPDGREYVIAPPAGQLPPAPWVNVLANPRFGSVVSEGGSAFTWCENAHELRLTPWRNDPVTDASGETLYLRDEETGQVWHPTSLPSRGDLRKDSEGSPYRTRHGFGYSVFEHEQNGIRSELTVFVAIDAAVKFTRLLLRNNSNRSRRLSVTGYVEWVLGDSRAKTGAHIVTAIAAGTGALLARNHFNNDFGDWVAFFDVDESDRRSASVTCDRTEFLGRNGSMRWPAAMKAKRLSGRVGAALDPCAAIQVPIELAPGQSREVVFRLGMGRSADEANQLMQRFRGVGAAGQALGAVHAHWNHTLSAVQVTTPDPALNLLANGWLVYQTLACRLWARSGFYQPGGAYGFRDQLQDAMALVHVQPRLLREQLLRCAGRQFVEGDVQHWWHPPSGRGVRTRISDDYLWLPLALCRYMQATRDSAVLNEMLPYLDGRPLPPADESYYDLPSQSARSGRLYEHAVRALVHGMHYGAHGLPLMGVGDWNDGMNRVGHQGRGESVWLGFFLCDVLRQFAKLAHEVGDASFAQRCDAERQKLASSIEASGWDGDWYRRAYFDDGTPLGSRENAECQIDAIAQSWSVLSGVGDSRRVRRAMDSVAQRLVRPDLGLVQLLDPPFDGRGPMPGYIAGYVPGVRENGGQYTHGAIWTAMAFAALGDAEHAWEVMDLINPLLHGRTAAEVALYKVEPYVVAADVYSMAPHTGRGGWTWYTGSAGWMYRLILESLLGVRLQVTTAGAFLQVAPCLRSDWSGFTVNYRFGEAMYRVQVERGETPQVLVDGIVRDGPEIALRDDGARHEVCVRLAPV